MLSTQIQTPFAYGNLNINKMLVNDIIVVMTKRQIIHRLAVTRVSHGSSGRCCQ